ncbi:MAG: protein kinase [Planctomycetes bacterium]|nr:protein kinase [Planctomycetota bacterium]
MSAELPDRALRRLLDDAKPYLAPEPGMLLRGRYRILSERGRGGMGIVFEAYDEELQRRVALKLLAISPALAPEGRARFVREARAAARLAHPGIAAVYDADDELIVMQLVEGGSMLRFVGCDPREAARLVRDAAAAIHAAHSEGIVHRDVKPQNLLVEGSRVLVTDFGLAKEIASDASLSATGQVMGTPSYLAPEQAAGRIHEIDARTDVWGLGATLYHLLSGRPPFGSDEVLAVLRRVLEEEPPPVRALRPEVDPDLALIVHQCLFKERERRYESAAALADDLSRWIEGRPVAARAPTFGYRARKLFARHRALAGLGAVALVAFAAAGFAAWSERSQRVASAQALDLSQFIDHVLADASVHERLGEREFARARLDEGIARCRAFLLQFEVARARALLGRCLRARGDAEASRAELDRALALDPALFDARLERGCLLAGELLSIQAQQSKSMRVDDPAALSPECQGLRAQALQDFQALDGDLSGVRRLDVALARGERARLLGDLHSARREIEEAVRLDPTSADAVVALSRLDLAEGRGDAAWYRAMSAIDLYRGLAPAYVAKAGAAREVDRVAARHGLTAAQGRVASGDRSPEALLELASAKLQLDDVEGALSDFNAALASDPRDATALGARGVAHARLAAKASSSGRASEAMEAWERAAEDFSAALLLEPTLLGALNNRGVAWAERERLLERSGKFEEAAAERSRAIADFDRALEGAPRFALALRNRALARLRECEVELRGRHWVLGRQALDLAKGDFEQLSRLNPTAVEMASDLQRLRELEGRLPDPLGHR